MSSNNNFKRRFSTEFVDVSSPTFNARPVPPEDINSYKSLCRKTLETCEFCDKSYVNRFESIIHNAKHIIIPLQNQTVYHCMECLHCFTSQKALNNHRIVKHITQKEPQVVLVKTEPLDINNTDIITISDTETDSIPNHDSKTQNHNSKIKNHNSKIKNRVIFEDHDLNDNSEYKIENVDSKVESNFKIKNRLLFEEDLIDSDILLTDLTNECKVKVEMFEPQWFVDPNDEFRERCVGYDELMRPGVYRCKKCFRTFPNRYETIVHETTHISLEKCQIRLCSICDTYIIGDLNKLKCHYKEVHGNQDITNMRICNKCGKKCLDLESHKRLQCPFYKTGNFNMRKLIKKHSNEIDCDDGTENICQRNGVNYKEYSKVINLCDICFSFCKNTQRIYYVLLGVTNELGKRFQCTMCGGLFFEVKLVERVSRRRCIEREGRKKNTLSNEARLKNIQQRLKMLK